MSERAELTNRIEEILRDRAYDEHAFDEGVFGELLDEIDEAIKATTTMEFGYFGESLRVKEDDK